MKSLFFFILLNALVFSVLGSSEVVTVSYVKDKIYSLRNSYLLTEEKCVASRIQNECGVCGQDDYVTNSNKNAAQCNDESISHFFKDVLPEGALLNQVKISVNGSFCGANIKLGLNSELIGTFSSKEQCTCNTSKSCEDSSTIVFSSNYNIEDGGFPDYFYGVSNKLWIQATSGTIKLISATIELTYNETASMKQRATCPAIKSAKESCFISSEKANPSCFRLSDIFSDDQLIDPKKVKVQVLQCSSVDREFCNEVKSTKSYKMDTEKSEICFNALSCEGISPKSPCVRFFDVKVSSTGCPSVTYTHGVPNKKESSSYGNNNSNKVKCQTKPFALPPLPAVAVISNTASKSRNFQGNMGFKFTVAKPLLVTELGQLCNPINGIAPVKVAIWTVADEKMITSLEFNTVTCTKNEYQYQKIQKQVTLTPGVEYIITGYNDNSYGQVLYSDYTKSFDFDKAITYLGSFGNLQLEYSFVFPAWDTLDRNDPLHFAQGNFKFFAE